MNKYRKKLLVGLLALVAGMITANAKELTVSELLKEVEAKDSNVQDVYIIGNYAFTSSYGLTSQDIMLAARSIDVSALENPTSINNRTKTGNVYPEMLMQHLNRTMDINGRYTNWNIKNPKIGTSDKKLTDLNQKLNIDYIDYEYLKKDIKFNVDINKVEDESFTELLKELDFNGGNKNFSEGLSLDEKGKLTGLLLKKNVMKDTVFGKDDQKGYYFAFVLEVTNPNKNIKITLTGAKNTKEFTYDNFDKHENGVSSLLVLYAIDPTKENKKLDITIDNGEEYKEEKYTIDYSSLNLQGESTASISVDSETVPLTDKLQLNNWGYVFPNNILLSKENTSHNKGDLTYDAEQGKLNGTIKEQKLKGGFEAKDLDSYFFTYTIKPEVVTDNIKVTIKAGKNSKEFHKSDFTEGVLTVLQHIPLSGEEDDKKITITVDCDGDGKKYLPSKNYDLDYTDVDLVKWHTVTFENTNLESVQVYDGEKLNKPEGPTKTKYENFKHWNKQIGEKPNSESDTEFQFTSDISNDAITDNTTLYPIWEIDVNQYITDSLTSINANENNKDTFKFETTEENKNLKLEILNGETKIDEIKDTGIASTIAHALASSEIEKINLKLGSNEKELKAGTETEEDKIKEQVTADLKEFLKKVVNSDNSSEKTLNDLYSAWSTASETSNKLELTVYPEKTTAKLKDNSEDDGSDKYTIAIEKELKIEFDAGSVKNPENKYLKTGESLASENLPTPQIPETEQKYRTFTGWYEEGSKVTSLDNVLTDKKLKAHYNLNVEQFINDVIADLNADENTAYSDNFAGKFDLEQDKNNITIKVDGVKVPLTELAETSIPGTIAYILEKDEIKDITLTAGTGSNKVVFNKNYTNSTKTYDGSDQRDETLLGDTGIKLKKEIIKGAKEVFDKELSNHENTATLDQLEYDDETFTIEIGDSKDDSITLINNAGTTLQDTEKKYTFDFDADFAVVKENGDLGAETIEEVLKNDKNYNTIYIDSNIEITDPINITKDVNIASAPNATGISLTSEDKKTIEVTDKDYVFDIGTIIADPKAEPKPEVANVKVTISDLELKGGKKAELKVENGATATVNNLKLTRGSKNIEAGILVDYQGTLTVNDLTFAEETHEIPSVKGLRLVDNSYAVYPTAKVTFTKATLSKSNFINVKIHNKKWCADNKGEHPDQLEDCKNISYSDEYVYYGDSFYYLNSKNIKNYKLIVFRNDDVSAGHMIKLFTDGEVIKPLELEEKEKQVTKNDKEYYFVGWGTYNGDEKYYSKIILDWENNNSNNNNHYFAYYAEKDHTITVDTNSLDVGGIDKYNGKTFKTYKFADLKNGMTIGQLKAIDSDFAKMWEDLDKNKGPMQIQLNGVEATDSTLINSDSKLTIAAAIE